MTSDPAAQLNRDFFTVVVEQEMLTEEIAHELTQEAARSKTDPSQLVLKRGLLSMTQVDIVETLLDPTNVVPGYEILEVLGQGGMGVVYRARQISLDRIVAIKTVLVSQMADPSVLSRFEQEAVTVGRLRHPNIVAAYDFGKHAGRLFFAMELIEGQDAEQLLVSRGRVDEATAWGLARQAAAGLTHAAREGVVHRDIKPANLLLVDPPDGFPLPPGLPMVKIADFGLAFLTTDLESRTRLTAENSTIGSPHYMAPEQLEGESFDGGVDIYALGASVYHLLAGRPAFDAKRLSHIIAAKLTKEVEPLKNIVPEVSQAGSDLLSHMMAREPGERLAGYAELIRRIDALDLGSPAPITVQPTDQLEVTSTEAEMSTGVITKQGTETLVNPRPKKRRGLIAATIAIVLLLAGGAGLLLLSASAERRIDPSAGTRVLVPGTYFEPLYNGLGLKGWVPNNGNWGVANGPEGAKVISGKGGFLRRNLFRTDLKQRLELQNYRVELAFWLNQAQAVELHFAIAQTSDEGESCYVLRVESERMAVGRRSEQSDDFQPIGKWIEGTAKGPEASYAVTLERQRNGWWVLVDGKLVAQLPDEQERYVARFDLGAFEGPAWFGDVFVRDLVLPETESAE